MKSKEYQKLYQNIKEKAPLEGGVQMLVYMFLFEIIEDTNYQLLVIDRMGKKTQFVTPVGISDLAIVSDEFRFSEEHKNNIISYVEIKGININIYDFEEQIKGQLLSCGRILCTNGNSWKYYDIEKYIKDNSRDDINYIWNKNEYEKIRKVIYKLELIEKVLAIKNSSYAHTKKNQYRVTYEKEINELNEKKVEIHGELEKSLLNFSLLQDIIDNPIIDRNLFNNDSFDVISYMKLKSELYDVISTW